MFYSIKQATLFLLTSMTSVGLLIMNGDIFVYAQKQEGAMQDFTRYGEYYTYNIPPGSTSAVQPLQYFPTAITTLPSSSPIQNVQLTQQQVTVEICSNGIDDDRDGIIDEVGCTFQQQQQQQFQQQQIFPPPTPIIPIIPRPPAPQPSPISQCEIYTLSVGGSSNLAKVKRSLNGKTDLTFEISSILNPYHPSVRYNDLVSGKLYIDKDKNTEKELNFHVKRITNDCKVIAYLDDEVRIQHDDDD